MKTPRTLLAALAGWFAASATADAQTTIIPVKEDVIQLSPFEVSAEKDTGYRASGTLAGTRLRTELRDVAASVSVITKEFMQDIGANNLEGLLTYTTGDSSGFLNGRRLLDDVIAAVLGLATDGAVPSDCIGNDSNFRSSWPFLAPAN